LRKNLLQAQRTPFPSILPWNQRKHLEIRWIKIISKSERYRDTVKLRIPQNQPEAEKRSGRRRNAEKERRRKDKRGMEEGSEREVREKAPLLTRELAIREYTAVN
jgi:hypothetical protein